MFKLDGIGKRILVISDLHFPWAIDHWFEFLSDLHKKRKYDIVISIGDEVDNAAISFHEKEDGMPSASKELEMAIDDMSLMHTLFPKMYILESNHGSLIYRKSKFAGIPYAYLKPLNELYGTPLYEWHNEILLRTKMGPVYLCHGKKAGFGAMTKEMGVSTIQGHYHNSSGITFNKTAGGMRYSAFTGCLADQKKIAFNYSKANVGQFINSVIEIDKNGMPRVILA